MTVIAVAGGSGGVGKTVVESLLEHSTYKVVILTRSQKDPDEVLKQTQQVEINYDDVDSLTKTLDEHAVHTIISAIGLFDETTSQSQLNLIQAAEQSKSTKRFIPSEYSFIQTKELLPIDPSIQHWLDAVDLLKKTNLQYTRVIPGFFMDYWGMPHIRTNLTPLTFAIDLVNCKAAIPGDGNDTISMTYTYDMARFIVELLALEEWPELSAYVGDDLTYNELLLLAEQVRGKKFDVVYDPPEKIDAGEVTVPWQPEEAPYSDEEARELTALVSRLVISGAMKVPVEGRMNSRFPNLQPVKMREFLEANWGGQK